MINPATALYKENSMTSKTFEKAALVLSLLALTSCADMNAREQRILTGAAAGTAIGAAGTVLTGGCVACGAAIGAGVGAAGGFIADQMYPEPGHR